MDEANTHKDEEEKAYQYNPDNEQFADQFPAQEGTPSIDPDLPRVTCFGKNLLICKSLVPSSQIIHALTLIDMVRGQEVHTLNRRFDKLNALKGKILAFAGYEGREEEQRTNLMEHEGGSQESESDESETERTGSTLS